MSRFVKTVLVIWIMLIAFTAVFYALVSVSVMANILDTERRETRDDVQRLHRALVVSIDRIGYNVADWAQWDDSYSFVVDRNREFRESILQEVSYSILNINMIVFVDTSGRVVYGTLFDPSTRTITPIPRSLAELIGHESRLRRHPPGPRGTEGVLMVDGRPMLAASHPILTSRGTGPARGILIFGRWLDGPLVRQISRTILLNASIVPLGGSLPSDFRHARKLVTKRMPIAVLALNDKEMGGYRIVNDFRGKPALMLRVISDRGIYRQGRRLTAELLTALVLLSVLFGVTTTTLLWQARRREREAETQKGEFYRRTILAATEGKLVISDYKEIIEMADSPIECWDVNAASDIGAMRDALRRAAAAEGMDESRLDDLVVCAGEMATNALNHAGGGCACLHRVGDSLVGVVSDAGPGIQAVALPHVALELGYTTAVSVGVGYKLMISLADKVYLATGPEGTTVAVRMELRGPALEDPYGQFREG